MELISLKDALREIDAVDAGGFPKVNHLVFVTADRRRRTGGKVIEIKQAVVNRPRLTKAQMSNYDNQQRAEMSQTNRFRKIKARYGDQVIPVQIDLILIVNGKGVM